MHTAVDVLAAQAPLSILYLEIGDSDIAQIVESLKRTRFRSVGTRATSREEFDRALAAFQHNVVIAEDGLNGWSVLDALRVLQKHDSSVPLLVLARNLTPARAVELMRAGVSDVILSSDAAEVAAAISRAVEARAIRQVHRATDLALRDSERKFRILADALPAAVLIYRGSRFLFANRAAISLSGYSQDDLQRLGTWELLHPDSHATLIETGFASLRDPQSASRMEIKILTREGNVQRWDAAITGIEFEGDSAGLLTAFEANGKHVDGSYDAQAQARDPLTGMLTTAALDSVFRSESRRSERSGRSFSLLLIRAVDSARSSETPTPLETNRDLCKLANVIGEVCRLNDVPFRYSARELAIILPETSMAGARYLVNRIVSRLESEEIGAAIFAGAASFPKDGSTVEQVVQTASLELSCVRPGRVAELSRSA